MTQDRLDVIFAEVRSGLVPLIQKIKSHGVPPDDSILKGKSFDVEKQAALCRQIALDLGFDIAQGRLDVSVHPFTGGAGKTSQNTVWRMTWAAFLTVDYACARQDRLM